MPSILSHIRVAGAIAALSGLALVACLSAAAPAEDRGQAAVKLQIVGGLGGVSQYTKLEKPFWESEITRRSQGRIAAMIRPMDGGGLRPQEMLQLMRLGVVPIGTALLSVVSGDDPELNAVDQPVLNPDMVTLRQTVHVFRGRLRDILLARYNIELLGIYAYPAQVVFCSKAFTGLDDLAGRRVRTSSVSQSELMTGLGAIPVLLRFAEVAPALRDGVVDCAITGTLSGYEIGLYDYTSHVHAMALSWGLSVFGANVTAWKALPPADRLVIRNGVTELENRIWKQAETDTNRGLACNAGTADCGVVPARPMTVVATSQSDAQRRNQILRDVVLPRWIERCGEICMQDWNTYFAVLHGIKVGTK
ncbi:TRAP transporter substrate-binding protein [Kaistia algarum]|uniref:TRAP transporter substrate-binding protein n=1 Tax=Kaistia algarum TaxID=2083279 RepID=UPI001A9C353C|nr:TRAP transporter substrate-binding protein [Kaistia algarum]MCX5514009.1 TRAP transporter substrate-binding protein [Kaistia algarum]